MQGNRPKLSLRHDGGQAATESDTLAVLLHVIGHELGVRATYNRGQLILAPYILYERNGEPFVDGVVVERDGIRPTETKLGTFKLSGLRHPVATADPVQRLVGFSTTDPRYGEKILASIND